MWGPGWWGPGPWMMGLGWIFPLIGLTIALIFVIAMVRAMSRGSGFMCMGGHHAAASDEAAELRRELRELRDEIKELKVSR